jgi:hypothetical protein
MLNRVMWPGSPSMFVVLRVPNAHNTVALEGVEHGEHQTVALLALPASESQHTTVLDTRPSKSGFCPH